MSRLGQKRQAPPRPDPARVVLDVRPLQEPDRSPGTADYLEAILAAFAADPLPGESFVILTQAGLPDPTVEMSELAGLPVTGRRSLPPTRLLRSGALTTDPFLLRSASVAPTLRWGRLAGAGAGGDRAGGAPTDAPTLFHTASGSVPIMSRLPVAVTLLDLAPWELPRTFQRSPAARFGQRLRARILRDASVVIVPSEAAAAGARRLLGIRPSRLRVVPLAPRAAFLPGDAVTATGTAGTLPDLDLPARYLVHPGRFDARTDLETLLGALASLVSAGRPPGLATDVPWPPRIVVADASPDDRAEIARAAAPFGVGELLSYVPHLGVVQLAALVRGARALLVPMISATAAQPVVDAVAAGVPVVASSVGGLPEAVGGAGLLVRPRDERRLAAALATIWSDDAVRERLAAAARSSIGPSGPRTWSDVATDTRMIYASVVRSALAGAAVGD